MNTHSRRQNGDLQHLAWSFTRRVATVLLAMFLATSAQADIVLEHIDGLSSDFIIPSLSGDGQWMVWRETKSPPVIGLQNLTTSVQTLLDLRTTTGDSGLNFGNQQDPYFNHDGSRIVMAIADDGYSKPNIALVVDATGTEIARLTVVETNTAPVGLSSQKIFIDNSGRYVVFSVGRGYTDANLTSVVSGVEKETYHSVGAPRDIFRFDTVDGSIDLVSADEYGGEVEQHADTWGVSDGGQYVMFTTSADNMPGADGTEKIYIRDMTKTGAGSVEQVAVDPDGVAFSFDGIPYMSDDGNRVLLYRRPQSSPDNLPHSYLWERGKGSRELAAFTRDAYYGRHLSGDGRWAVGGRDVFSRLNVNTGGIYTFTGADEDSQTLISKPVQSNNGEVLLFQNTSLTRPPGEDGTWWVLRYDALPTLEAQVNEVIMVTDGAVVTTPIVLELFETIHVSDTPRILPNVTVSVLELITLNDESLADVQPLPGDVITITLLSVPLVPGSVFQIDAGGFKPLTQVQVFLQSEPVLVGVETADVDGKVSHMITIPLDFPPGDHTLILLGQKPDGSERRLTAPITIELPDEVFKDSFE